MMTLDDLVELARHGMRTFNSGNDISPATSVALCEGILDVVAESDPCGWERPTITSIPKEDPSWVRVPTSWKGVVKPEDARHMARMLLRAADEAESA